MAQNTAVVYLHKKVDLLLLGDNWKIGSLCAPCWSPRPWEEAQAEGAAGSATALAHSEVLGGLARLRHSGHREASAGSCHSESQLGLGIGGTPSAREAPQETCVGRAVSNCSYSAQMPCLLKERMNEEVDEARHVGREIRDEFTS